MLRPSTADQALLDNLAVPADIGTPQAAASWFWALWLCRPVFTARQTAATPAEAEAMPDDPAPVASLLDLGMITSAHVAAFAEALEQSVADELSGRGYSTLCLGALPLQRIVSGLGLSYDQLKSVLGDLVMWVYASGRVQLRADPASGPVRTLWPEHLAALDLQWHAAADRAAAWTDDSLGTRHGQEWEWTGTRYLVALALYVLSHRDGLPPDQVLPARVADLLADDGLERIGGPLLTGLGHPLTRSFDDRPSAAWSWLTRTWPEIEEPSPASRWSSLSRRPDTPDTDNPAWTVCTDWAITAARQAA